MDWLREWTKDQLADYFVAARVLMNSKAGAITDRDWSTLSGKIPRPISEMKQLRDSFGHLILAGESTPEQFVAAVQNRDVTEFDVHRPISNAVKMRRSTKLSARAAEGVITEEVVRNSTRSAKRAAATGKPLDMLGSDSAPLVSGISDFTDSTDDVARLLAFGFGTPPSPAPMKTMNIADPYEMGHHSMILDDESVDSMAVDAILPRTLPSSAPSSPKALLVRKVESRVGRPPGRKNRTRTTISEEEERLDAAHTFSRSRLPPCDTQPHVDALTTAIDSPGSDKLRQWCLYEWFYPNIDQDWFQQNDFVSMLHSLKLARMEYGTKSQWNIVRQCLGKPRRLSPNFFQQEREQLEQHRRKVRMLRPQNRAAASTSTLVAGNAATLTPTHGAGGSSTNLNDSFTSTGEESFSASGMIGAHTLEHSSRSQGPQHLYPHYQQQQQQQSQQPHSDALQQSIRVGVGTLGASNAHGIGYIAKDKSQVIPKGTPVLIWTRGIVSARPPVNALGTRKRKRTEEVDSEGELLFEESTDAEEEETSEAAKDSSTHSKETMHQHQQQQHLQQQKQQQQQEEEEQHQQDQEQEPTQPMDQPTSEPSTASMNLDIQSSATASQESTQESSNKASLAVARTGSDAGHSAISSTPPLPNNITTTTPHASSLNTTNTTNNGIYSHLASRFPTFTSYHGRPPPKELFMSELITGKVVKCKKDNTYQIHLSGSLSDGSHVITVDDVHIMSCEVNRAVAKKRGAVVYCKVEINPSTVQSRLAPRRNVTDYLLKHAAMQTPNFVTHDYELTAIVILLLDWKEQALSEMGKVLDSLEKVKKTLDAVAAGKKHLAPTSINTLNNKHATFQTILFDLCERIQVINAQLALYRPKQRERKNLVVSSHVTASAIQSSRTLASVALSRAPLPTPQTSSSFSSSKEQHDVTVKSEFSDISSAMIGVSSVEHDVPCVKISAATTPFPQDPTPTSMECEDSNISRIASSATTNLASNSSSFRSNQNSAMMEEREGGEPERDQVVQPTEVASNVFGSEGSQQKQQQLQHQTHQNQQLHRLDASAALVIAAMDVDAPSTITNPHRIESKSNDATKSNMVGDIETSSEAAKSFLEAATTPTTTSAPPTTTTTIPSGDTDLPISSPPSAPARLAAGIGAESAPADAILALTTPPTTTTTSSSSTATTTATISSLEPSIGKSPEKDEIRRLEDESVMTLIERLGSTPIKQRAAAASMPSHPSSPMTRSASAASSNLFGLNPPPSSNSPFFGNEMLFAVEPETDPLDKESIFIQDRVASALSVLKILNHEGLTPELREASVNMALDILHQSDIPLAPQNEAIMNRIRSLCSSILHHLAAPDYR